MQNSKNDNLQVFADVIVSLSINATSQVEGMIIKNPEVTTKKSIKNKSIKVTFLPNDKIAIDVFCEIIYGYAVSDVVSLAQEKIIESVESATKYKVQSVNVQVTGVIVP